MLSNRWRCFLINSCFVSRSVCFLQLPLFLLSSSSSTLSNSSVNMNNVFHCEVDSPSVGASAATHTLTAVVHCLLLQRCSCYCVHALDLLWLVFTSHYSRSTAPLISPRPRNLFCFVLLTEPNVTQDFRASPGAARQVAGGGPRQVWPRPPCISQNLLPICPCMVWTAAEDSSSWHTCCRFTQHSAAVCSLIHTISVYCKNTNQLKLFVSLGWIFLFLSVTTLCWCSGSV